jgi:UDP-glucose 4-epimerase
MNILFIGGAGFIGSNIISNIITCKYNWNIFVLELPGADLSRLVGMDITVIRGELSNIDMVQSLLDINRIDCVVHLVSTLIPNSTFEDYKREYLNVIFPSIELMSLCAKKHIKFVYFSSGGTIYGDRTTTIPFVETDSILPISYYGWSKQIMENAIAYANRTEGLEYLILRPSNPYGHGQRLHAQQGLIAVSIGKLLAGEDIEIWGDGDSLRDYIYIDDLADIVVQLLRKKISNTILNIGSEKGYSVNNIIFELQKIVGKKIQVKHVPMKKSNVKNMILNTTKLRKLVKVNITPLHRGMVKFYSQAKKLNSKK